MPETENYIKIGKDAMWWGKLSEFYQKVENYYMYEYYHSKFIEGQEKYFRLRGLKFPIDKAEVTE